MAAFETVLFWLPIAFGFVVAGPYVGTKLALRSYFDDERVGVRDASGVEDGRER